MIGGTFLKPLSCYVFHGVYSNDTEVLLHDKEIGCRLVVEFYHSSGEIHLNRITSYPFFFNFHEVPNEIT
ncbi:MAG: hypothetical protein LBC39_09040 [Methanobrevibacter sp.]|jgi:hypothetical protein|nr:hypothetical protein [Candidatus Methanovirga aequatorialis]